MSTPLYVCVDEHRQVNPDKNCCLAQSFWGSDGWKRQLWVWHFGHSKEKLPYRLNARELHSNHVLAVLYSATTCEHNTYK